MSKFGRKLYLIKNSHTLYKISLLQDISKSLQRLTRQTELWEGLWGVSHTSKLGTFFLRSLTLHKPIYSNFQKNGASGETVF